MQLHGLIVLWGITSIIGRWINVPAVELVFYRTALAAAAMGVIIYARGRSVKLPWKQAVGLLLTGFLIGLHWILFFLSAKIASASICLAGLATCTLWTALLKPIFFRTFRWKVYELVLGIIMLGALYVIFRFQADHKVGLIIALVSALFATVFIIINGLLIKRYHFLVMTFYELAGACLFCVLFTPAYLAWFSDSGQFEVPATFKDWGWLLVLSLGCTVLAFTGYVELLNRMDVFSINLASNLEPVYGMILAALLDGDWKKMNLGFYGGSAIILAAIVAYPWFKRWDAGRL